MSVGRSTDSLSVAPEPHARSTYCATGRGGHLTRRPRVVACSTASVERLVSCLGSNNRPCLDQARPYDFDVLAGALHVLARRMRCSCAIGCAINLCRSAEARGVLTAPPSRPRAGSLLLPNRVGRAVSYMLPGALSQHATAHRPRPRQLTGCKLHPTAQHMPPHRAIASSLPFSKFSCCSRPQAEGS